MTLLIITVMMTVTTIMMIMIMIVVVVVMVMVMVLVTMTTMVILITRRANAQTFYIRHIYRTSLQSLPLRNQPSRISEILHANLQQNDCVSPTFPVTLSS